MLFDIWQIVFQSIAAWKITKTEGTFSVYELSGRKEFRNTEHTGKGERLSKGKAVGNILSYD